MLNSKSLYKDFMSLEKQIEAILNILVSSRDQEISFIASLIFQKLTNVIHRLIILYSMMST